MICCDDKALEGVCAFISVQHTHRQPGPPRDRDIASGANGNLTSNGANSFSYDPENRLVAASGAHAATLSYDPLRRLWQVTVGSSTTRFLYDGNALAGEYDGNGALTHRYAHWVGADVPVVSYAGSGLTQPSYLHADQQGSIVALSDASGLVTAIDSYDEYGIPASSNSGRFQYTGQVWLAELGLYYYKARFYSPTVGRFLQTDSIGYSDQYNLYSYVGNDPVNFVDSSGECRSGATATGASGRGVTTIIFCSDGYDEVRQGGSRAWRNNNVGNLKYGPFARRHGAIGGVGSDPEHIFSVFPDVATGGGALGALLTSPRYRNMTADEVIQSYAPREDGNDTRSYQRQVRRALGDAAQQPVERLTSGQLGSMVSEIVRREGYIVGRVEYRQHDDGTTTARAQVGTTGSRITKTVECSSDGERATCH